MTDKQIAQMGADLDEIERNIIALTSERDNLRIEVGSYAETIGQFQALADKGLPIEIGGRRYVVEAERESMQALADKGMPILFGDKLYVWRKDRSTEADLRMRNARLSAALASAAFHLEYVHSNLYWQGGWMPLLVKKGDTYQAIDHTALNNCTIAAQKARDVLSQQTVVDPNSAEGWGVLPEGQPASSADDVVYIGNRAYRAEQEKPRKDYGALIIGFCVGALFGGIWAANSAWDFFGGVL